MRHTVCRTELCLFRTSRNVYQKIYNFCFLKDTELQYQAKSDESSQQETEGGDLRPLALQVHPQRDVSLKPAVQRAHPERHQGAGVMNLHQSKELQTSVSQSVRERRSRWDAVPVSQEPRSPGSSRQSSFQSRRWRRTPIQPRSATVCITCSSAAGIWGSRWPTLREEPNSYRWFTWRPPVLKDYTTNNKLGILLFTWVVFIFLSQFEWNT